MIQTPAVLHVPYTFFPDACGGTEVYVRGLAQRLASRGYLSAVAAPGVEPSEYVNDGLPVYRFATDRRRRLELAYGFPDEVVRAPSGSRRQTKSSEAFLIICSSCGMLPV